MKRVYNLQNIINLTGYYARISCVYVGRQRKRIFKIRQKTKSVSNFLADRYKMCENIISPRTNFLHGIQNHQKKRSRASFHFSDLDLVAIMSKTIVNRVEIETKTFFVLYIRQVAIEFRSCVFETTNFVKRRLLLKLSYFLYFCGGIMYLTRIIRLLVEILLSSRKDSCLALYCSFNLLIEHHATSSSLFSHKTTLRQYVLNLLYI